MIILNTTTGQQNIFCIPREYVLSGLTANLMDDITGIVENPTAENFVRIGDYLKGELEFNNLKEDRFYTLKLVKDTGDVIYKDKVFVTDQTLDQRDNDMYTINENTYVENETENNDYIVL